MTAVAASTTTLAVAGAPAAQTAPTGLTFVVASPSVTLVHRRGKPVEFDLGTHIAAGGNPFEIHVKRKSYRAPLTATQVIRNGDQTQHKPLPPGLIKKFSGMSKFLRVKVYNSRGKKVADFQQTFCPNSEPGRHRPDAPGQSPYPDGCYSMPFTLGSVWGVQRGWSARAGYGKRLKLKNGKYIAKITVAKSYRDLFGIASPKKTVKVRIKTGNPHPGRQQSSASPQPNRNRPTGPDRVPEGPKPDLRSLPAWGISVKNKRTGKSYLRFSANVWNAGPSRVAVDGFRRPKEDLMDAYQYFYDDKGNETGYARAGTMEWDPRDGHLHWHFTDFAGYRLLKANKSTAVRSHKEAFCLANTDAIDYTVKNANWKPDGTELESACGERSSLSVRETLEVGSGDTYDQFRPGQAFNISRVPNGTYYIQVTANPKRRLFETNMGNNVSLRKVILGGKRGKRTVKVPPYQGIKAR